jgi:hypothetical protein
VIDFFFGRVTRRTLLILIPLIFASYFGILIFAIRAVPGPFDWRYKSISKLLYIQIDPEFHSIVAIGIAVAGMLMVPFAGYIGRRFRSSSPIMATVGAGALGAGAVLLILAAAIVSQPGGGSSRGLNLHEMLARLCGVALGIGILAFYFCAVRSRVDYNRRLFIAWSMIIPPAIIIAAMRALAAFRLRWPDPIARAIQSRALWHLGFWEWVGSAAIFLFLLSAALFLPNSEPDPHRK